MSFSTPVYSSSPTHRAAFSSPIHTDDHKFLSSSYLPSPQYSPYPSHQYTSTSYSYQYPSALNSNDTHDTWQPYQASYPPPLATPHYAPAQHPASIQQIPRSFSNPTIPSQRFPSIAPTGLPHSTSSIPLDEKHFIPTVSYSSRHSSDSGSSSPDVIEPAAVQEERLRIAQGEAMNWGLTDNDLIERLKKSVNPDGSVNRPPNCFILFRKCISGTVEYVSKVAGEKWKGLDPAEKIIYTQKAQLYREAFDRKHPKFPWPRSANGEGKSSRSKAVKAAKASLAASNARRDALLGHGLSSFDKMKRRKTTSPQVPDSHIYGQQYQQPAPAYQPSVFESSMDDKWYTPVDRTYTWAPVGAIPSPNSPPPTSTWGYQIPSVLLPSSQYQ